MSVAEVVGKIERDMGDLLGIGLAAADPAQTQDFARQLREIGLEGPAKEAERLVSLVGPSASAVEQLESFAKLRRMLETVRLRLLHPEALPEVETVPIPSLPSVHVEKAVFEARVAGSLIDTPAPSDLIGRLAYIERVDRAFRGPPIPPEGDGAVVWADLSLGGRLAEGLAAQPSVAFECARRAVGFGNFVIRRNAVRVLERLLVPRAPVPDTDPAMGVLLQVMCGGKPLLMHDAYVAWRRAKGLPPVDLREPYLGLFDGRTNMALAKKAARVRPIPGPPPPPSLFQKLRGAPAPEAPPKRSEIWYENPEDFNTDDLREYRGSRGEVLERLGRSAREAPTKEDRIRALRRVMFLEDPLAIPAVRQVGGHDASAEVRQAALLTLAHLGDDGILPICRTALQERGTTAGVAARALGVLADMRGFPILWSAYERNLRIEDVGWAFRLLFEASGPFLVKLSRAPKILARSTTFDTLRFTYEKELPNVLLHILDLAGDPKTQKALLRPLVLAKAPPAMKTTAQALQGRLAQRIADRSLPLDKRRDAVWQLREIAGAGADAVIGPAVARLAPDDRAAVLAGPEPKKKRKKKGAGVAG